MDGNYERSFIAWINSFNRDSSTPAASLSDLTSGDILLPIARTVLAGNDTGGVESDSDTGWLGVFALMKPAGLLEEDAEPPGAATPHEDKVALVRTTLEALLRHAVGEQCLCQEIIINKILSLDPEVQMGLRNIILGQQQQQHELSFEVATPGRESVREDEGLFEVSPVHSIRSKIASPPMGFDHALGLSSEGLESDEQSSGSNFSSLEGGQRERAAPIGPKKHSNSKNIPSYGASSKWVTVAASDFGSTSTTEAPDLQAEITRLEDKLADTVSVYTRSLDAMRNERDEAVAREQELSDRVWQAKQEEERAARLREDEVIEMEKDIHGKYETLIIGLQQRASEAEENVFRLKSLEEEVVELRDQVDILKPAEAKLTTMEETLNRYREQVEELGDLPAQLKREEAAHAEAIDRYLTLETEVKQVPVLRRQLQNFRLSKTEMEMTNRDQARTLKLAQEDVARLSSELLSLRASSDEVKNEHRRLQEELARRGTEEAQQEKGGLGIGEGMSELNPELSEELARLRHDNKQLNAQMDYNTVETIQDLEQKAEDANCLADSFHATLASERELRATAEASLAEARARIIELEAEIVKIRGEHQETLARLQDESNAAAAKAAADLVASHKEAQEVLAAAEEAAREVLESERRAAGERLAAFKRDAEDVAEGLRREMAAAEEAAVLRAENAWEERCEERTRLEAEVAEAHKVAARQREQAMEEKLAAGEAHALEVKEMEDEMSRERNEMAKREERAARELVEMRQGFEEELARAKCESEEKLEGVMISATRDLMEAREKTKQEELGRLEEAQRKEEVMAENMRLHEKLTTGERAALSAIEKLKADKKTQKQECALKLVQQKDNHDAQMAALNAEFDKYRRNHTVGDNDYHQDMNKWERIKTLNENKIRDLERQREQSQKDQRRLEREKTFYWGQAEELRMRLMETRGGEDPTKAADYAQLVMQNKELVEENRRLREGQQVSCQGGHAGASVRGQGRWGGSGVAAMRAEHESEMNAIKKEKQNLLMKYHDKANKMNEQEKENAELREENTKLQNEVIKYRLICERQKREFQESLSSMALISPSSGSSSDHNASMPKESQPKKASSKKRVHHRDENSDIEIQSKRRDSSPERALPSMVDEGFAKVPMAMQRAGPEEGVPTDCKQS